VRPPCKDCGQRESKPHRARCPACQTVYDRARRHRYYVRHRDRLCAAQRARRDPVRERDLKLRKLYGLSAAQVGDMVVAQAGRCAVCGGALSDPPCVDHDHVRGHVRALLCGGCNLGLGHFRDNPARLRAAAAYLDRYTVEVTI
jgi:hypothetical protein